MLSPVLKILTVWAIAIALGFMVNAAHAESYPSDAPNAGVSQATTKAKPKSDRVRFAPKQYVVHPQISTKKSGK